MVTLSVLAILAGAAAPSLRDLILNIRMTGQANDLMADLAMARSEASKRNVRVSLCTSSNGTSCTTSAWQQGWLVFIDQGATPNGSLDTGETVLKVANAFQTGNTMSATGAFTAAAGNAYISYRPSGVTTPGGSNVLFTMCDSRTTASVGAPAAQNRGRRITINSTGRAAVARYTC